MNGSVADKIEQKVAREGLITEVFVNNLTLSNNGFHVFLGDLPQEHPFNRMTRKDKSLILHTLTYEIFCRS